MDESTPEGAPISCERCGGTFPMRELWDRVRCPFCEHTQTLDDSSHAIVRDYQRAYRGGVQQAEGHARRARRKMQQQAASRSHVGVLVWMGLFALAFAGRPILDLLAAAGFDVSTKAYGWFLVALLLVGAALVVAPPVMRWMADRRGRRDDAPRAHVGAIECPHCGAPTSLEGGQAVRTCRHCGGALMPSAAVMIEGLDAVAGERRRNALAYHRERRRAEHEENRSGTRIIIPIALLVPLVTLVEWTQPIREQLGPRVVLALVVAALAVALALTCVGKLWHHHVAERRHRALAQLSQYLRGSAFRRMADFVQWLDATWAGPYASDKLRREFGFGCLIFEVRGYPAAVAINPTPGWPGVWGRPYFDVLLAASVPSANDLPKPSPLERAATDELHRLGFSVELTDGGILASAQPLGVRLLRQDPRTLEIVPAVVERLLRIGHGLGARPLLVEQPTREPRRLGERRRSSGA